MNGRLLCICYGSLEVLLEGIMGLMVAGDFATCIPNQLVHHILAAIF